MAGTVTPSLGNGPEPQVTPFVPDVPRRRGLRAAFFVIGRTLADPAARRCAERAHAGGHWIGSHGRTPGGPLGPHLLGAEARRVLAEGGYAIVAWRVVPGDWHDPDGRPDRALQACLAEPRPVLVPHDLPNGAMRRLDRFPGRLADAGAEFGQECPDEVLPMRGGVATSALRDFVTIGDNAACHA